MASNDPNTGYDLDTIVYDVNGHKVGTMAEIYPDDAGKPLPAANQTSRPS